MKTICIIGGGFSGSITAVQLLKKNKDVRIELVNAGNPLLTGVAYSTVQEEHLLNVPAGKMSASPDQPNGFTDWILSKPAYKELVSGNLHQAFLPRMIYGHYLNETLKVLIEDERIKITDSKAVDLQYLNNKYIVSLKDNTSIEAEYIVLAMGNYLPAAPKINNSSVLNNEHYYANPWNDSYLKGIKDTDSFLMIGSGLTMIDCMLDLIAADFKGKIYAVSPRGYLPEAHMPMEADYPDFSDELKEKNLKEIFKSIRMHVRNAQKKNIPWQSVIDKVRPHAREIWLSLSQKDKQQFISHVRHIWGVARHRLPLEVHKKMKTLLAKGQLEVMGGRLVSIENINKEFHVFVKHRKNAESKTLAVSRIINCTGPQINYKEVNDEFVKNLLSRDLIAADDLKMGIKALPGGQVLSKEGRSVKNMYAVGSLLRGVLWETTSVPDLKINAENVAEQISRSID
jgi:uncharacterized NAD(P)/FAD-binding protein YdhS